MPNESSLGTALQPGLLLGLQMHFGLQQVLMTWHQLYEGTATHCG